MAYVISDEKAYDVPGICRRIGLADGTKEEAFSSKYRYAHQRLQEVPAADLIDMARALAAETPDFTLLELLAKIDEVEGPEVTSLTRRRIIKLFGEGPLATEVEDVDLIRSVWPISTMPAPFQGADYTLEDDILRHTVANHDLTLAELLGHLGVLTCSRVQLFRFLEAVTAPEAQTAAVRVWVR